MSVKEIFETMEYGPAAESASEALAWLATQETGFGQFIDGAFTAPGDTFESRNPATGALLAKVTQATQADVDAAVAAARAAQPKWEKLGGPGRARHLYALARLLQKHARLFAVLETLDDLRAKLAYAREHAEKVGRSAPLDVCFSPFASRLESEGLDGHVKELAELGITWLAFAPEAPSRTAWCESIARLGENLRTSR